MAWVVKEVRFEAVASTLIEKAEEVADSVRAEAERDARRTRRVARREATDAAEYLAKLERIASELRVTVQGQRAGGRGEVSVEDKRPGKDRRRRGGRASLHTRAVADLFQRTDVPPRAG